MKNILHILILILFVGCVTSRKTHSEIINVGNLAYVEMIQLIGNTKIDSNRIKSVKIYSFEFKKNGKIKDSTLIEFQNLNYFGTVKNHTNYEIKYDSLGRDFERYATRIKTGETHLNYRKIYDLKSKITEWIIYNRDGKIYSKTFYDYDSLERLAKSEKYFGYFLYDKPILQRRKLFEYGKQKLIREIEFYSIDSDKEFDSKLIKEYNSQGQQINYKSETIENDIIVSFWGYQSYYNEQLLVKVKRYNSENRNEITEYRYNQEKLPIENYSFDFNSNKPTHLIKYYYLKNKKTTGNNVYN